MIGHFIDSLDVPVLDLGGKRGSTDYIDFLRPADLSHNVQKGIDCYNRKFVSLKLQTNYTRLVDKLNQWLFQRNVQQHLMNTLISSYLVETSFETMGYVHLPSLLSDLSCIVNSYLEVALLSSPFVITLFQRYTSNPEMFVLGGTFCEQICRGNGHTGGIYGTDSRFWDIKDLTLGAIPYIPLPPKNCWRHSPLSTLGWVELAP